MFDNLKLSLRIIVGILIVEFISLASGITMGRNITSRWVILGFIATVVISQIIAWFVTENIKKSVSEVSVDLSTTSSDLDSLAKNITNTSHKLAEGSTEQAASIQETSSTLEESSSMVHQTTQNTKEAENLSKRAKDAADKGNSEMQTMLSLMEELKHSSGEISKIIKVIDEIAFQTNILSLNAAVEAARAGDAGKGFAVVAEEVRNLAQRSAQAAKDTAGIIENNIDLSEKCLTITEQVSGSLGDINLEAGKVSELLSEITTASQEQEVGINQINKAIAQMETVLQENASTAQESAVSAGELSIHSENIKNIMSKLSSFINGNAQIDSSDSKKSISFSKKPEKKLKKQEVLQKTNKKSNNEGHQTTVNVVKEKYSEASMSIPETYEVKKIKTDTSKTVNPEDVIPLDDF